MNFKFFKIANFILTPLSVIIESKMERNATITLWSKIFEERRKNPYIGFFFPITKKHRMVSNTFLNRTSAFVGTFRHSPPTPRFSSGVLGAVKDDRSERNVVTRIRSAREQAVDLVKQNLETIPVVKFTKKRQSKFDIDFCVICMEHFKENDEVRVLKCQHTYHKNCIDTWLLQSASTPSCPLCKREAVNIRSCDGCSRMNCRSCGVGTWVYCKIGASLLD